MSLMEKLFSYSWKRYLASALLGAAVTAVVLVVKGAGNAWAWGDALSTGGALTVVWGILVLLARLGAFDMTGFMIENLTEKTRKHRDYFDYVEDRQHRHRESPWTFMPFVWTGLVFVAVGVVLLIAAA